MIKIIISVKSKTFDGNNLKYKRLIKYTQHKTYLNHLSISFLITSQ